MEKELTLNIKQIDPYRWKIEKEGAMRVEGIVYADSRIIEEIKRDLSLRQVANVATLPGIVRASLAMPDIHEGYGFPIGGVAAFDETGVVSGQSPGQPSS
jgi:tRNA-splicing ligase RtcB